MPANEELMRQMDEAAGQAQAELQPNVDAWSARDLMAWWTKWYVKAGHKRLGRILVGLGKRTRQP